MHSTRAPRLIRGTAAASVATLASALMHVSAGGAMPAPLGFAAAWILTVVVATVLAGRRLSLVRLAITVALSQVVFHHLFVFGAVGSAGLDTDPHAYHGTFLLPALPEGAATALQADAVMWIWHAAAALVTTALIHRGERLVLRLLALAREVAAWTRRTLARPASAAVLYPAPLAVPTPLGARFRVIAARFSTSLQQRGPPLRLAF